MKKKLVLLCVLALLVAGLVVNASAAEGDPTLTVATTTETVHPGGTVEFTISVSNPPDSGIVSIGADINVPTGLTFKSYQLSATADTFANKSVQANNFSLMNGSAVSLSGEVVTLTYDVAADATGDLTITLSNPSGSDGNWGILNSSNVNMVSGNVTVDHTWETMHDAVVADCQHFAVDAYYTCSDPACAGKIYSATDKSEITGGIDSITGTEKGPHHVNQTQVQAILPTCTEAGTIAHYTCGVEGCEEVFANATDTEPMEVVENEFHPEALGHDLVENTTASDATCTATGMKASWKCQREGCGLIFLTNDDSVKYATEGVAESSLTIDATGHSATPETHHDAVAAKFQVAGNKEYWHCANCYSADKITTEGDVTTDTNVYFLAREGTDPAEVDLENPVTWDDVEIPAITKFAGDVNDDKDVTLYDATMVFQYAAKNRATAITQWFEGEGSVGTVNGDVNSDGDITLYDATMIFQYAAKNPADAIQQWFRNNPGYQAPNA